VRTPILALALAAGLAGALGTPAHADLRTTYAAGPIIFPGAGPSTVEQIAVNKNVGSPYYGYVYVTDEGATVQSIRIYKPTSLNDRTGATSYTDTGMTIKLASPSTLVFFGLAVGSDDTVWVSDSGNNKVFSAPPVPTSGTSVNATLQFSNAGTGPIVTPATTPSSPFIRAINVVGPVTSAKVYLSCGNAPDVVQLWSGSATDANTTGTFTNTYTTINLGPTAGGGTNQVPQGPYGVAVDPAGNAYIANKASTPPTSAFLKIKPDGTLDSTYNAPLPTGVPATSNLAAAAFVADSNYAGGGYMYLSTFVTGSAAAGNVALRYDLSGNYLDGFGPALTSPPANYTAIAITRSTSAPPYVDADNLGNVYERMVNAGNSAAQKFIKRAAFVVATGSTSSAGGAVESSPTAVDGVVYAGSNDGKVYAYTTADGNPVSGFPVDLSAALGVTVRALSRPAVYFGTSGKAIYVTTDTGAVVKINPDGTIAWSYTAFAGPATGATSSTPALADGFVYAGVNGANGTYVLKLADATGTFTAVSPSLAPVGGDIDSPSVNSGLVYVGLKNGTPGDFAVLNASDLVVRASFATAEGVTAPPFVSGPDAFVGSLAGNFYKVNSITLALDPAFGAGAGTPGMAVVGEPLPTAAFPAANGAAITFFVGTAKGKIFSVNGQDGSQAELFDTGDATAQVGGVVVNATAGLLAFGTSAPVVPATTPPTSTGKFYELPLTAPAQGNVFSSYAGINTTPTLDRSTNRFFAGSDDTNIYGFPSR